MAHIEQVSRRAENSGRAVERRLHALQKRLGAYYATGVAELLKLAGEVF